MLGVIGRTEGKGEGTYDADTSTEGSGWEVHSEF
jgi:hypothetical protein